MRLDFSRKTVFVTGGLRGIGRQLSVDFARLGAKVVASYVSDRQAAESTAKQLELEGSSIIPIQMDVRHSGAVNDCVDSIEAAYGSIDILVNNAGIVKDGLMMAMSDEDWRDVIQTNLTGSFNVCRAVSKQMMRKRQGSIVNLSSVAALKPGRGQVNYAASKGAIESMTKALAVELSSKNIRVNSVAPGVIDTDMSREVRDHAGEQILQSILLRRYGSVQDVSNSVLFLASDFASYITGVTLAVDGGAKF
jgi:3-oxoacyl-[acyl-carrier protein] reductase